MVWLNSQRLGRKRTGRLVTRKSGKRYMEGPLSKWIQTLKIPVSPVNAQRASTVQVNKITCSMDVNQTLSPQSVLVQWAHK